MAVPLDPLIHKLILRMHAPDPVTRLNAVGALRLHGARAAAAIPDLRALTSDPDPKVCDEARRALAQLRKPAA